MILTEQRRKFLRLIDQLVFPAGPRGREKLQLMPKIHGLLTPFVEILHARGFRRQSERAMTCPVYTPEATLQGGPTSAFDPPIRKSREGAGGTFCHRGERFVLVEYVAGHFPLICQQRLMNLRQCPRFDCFRELLSELIHNLDKHVCVADLPERPSGIAKRPVLFAVDIVAELVAHQAQGGPHFLEALADLADRLGRRRAALRRVAFRAQVLERLFELAPHTARDPVAHRFLRLQLKRHVTTPVWTAGREDCSHARTERHTPATAKRIRKMTAVVRDFLQVKAFLVKPPGPPTYSEWNRTTERSSATFVAGRLS